MGKTIYVGNLSQDITEDRIRDLFSDHGAVVEIRLITDPYTGRPRGFAFVDMSTEDEAKTAISEVDGQTEGGQPLKVAEAKPRRRPEPDRLYASYPRW